MVDPNLRMFILVSSIVLIGLLIGYLVIVLQRKSEKEKKRMVNMNDFAKEITLQEGGAKSLSIAQVKEVLRLTFKKLAKMPFDQVLEIIARYK